MTTVTMDDSQN